MKSKISILIFVLLAFSFKVFGQFVVGLSASKTKTCKDSVIVFTATATDGGVPVTNAHFTWSFGDNTADQSGIMLSSVSHSYSEPGGYIVRLDVVDGINKDYALLKIETGLKPNFDGTKSDRDVPLCLGQQIFLTGKTAPFLWKYELPDLHTEISPSLVSHLNQFKSEFDKRIYNKTQVISSAFDFDTIGVNIEHSDIESVKIELKCPDGKSIILKDFGGADNKFFGEPIDIEGSNETGIAYEYFWTNTPVFGTMNSSIPAGNSLPSGSYTPEQPFTNLIGCPLNGIWEIIITDNQNNDNGFVFSSRLKFEESLTPGSWEYSNTYSSPLWLGSGVSSTSGSGLATAIPLAHGNHRYTFRVRDNYACFHDTSFINSVEAVSFTTTPDPPEGVFDLDIEFNNTTSWATTFEWDFGDQTEKVFSSSHTHTYTKDGRFKAILKAGTSDGCADIDSVLVIIGIPESIFSEMPGVFTPNGDGQNDIFFLSSNSLKGIKTLNCWIYSRWGKKVAEWNSVDDAINGWDGTIKDGPQASPGVYFYYLKAEGYDGKVYEKKSSFHLFR
jgi:gliding motility-associated-like protein